VSKADSLRVQDVRDAYRLIGDCRDLGSDPALWYRRMFEGLYLLFGTFQASGGRGVVASARPSARAHLGVQRER
jgi:hypothetical protein